MSENVTRIAETVAEVISDELLYGTMNPDGGIEFDGWIYPKPWSETIAAAVVAEINPTITIVAELCALPAKTVILDRDGEVFVYEDDVARGWFYPGDDDPLPHSMIALPATVLFRPV